MELLEASGVNSIEVFEKTNGITFGEQAAKFLAAVPLRTRRPVKNATLSSWESCVNKWLVPELGEIPLVSVGNGAAKTLIQKMTKTGLKAKSIRNHVQLLKTIVASAVDEEGNELYPRKWNSEFIELPFIREQKQPSFTEETVQRIVEKSSGQYRVLYTLLAATGMRIGEVFGLDVANIDLTNRIIYVKKSAWGTSIQDPKTPAAVREVDLTTDVAELLQQFIGPRTSGLLFRTANYKPLTQTNVSRRQIHPLLAELNVPKTSFHAFRRFRTTWLRKNATPEDMIKLWLGHADKTVTDGYSKLREDKKFRQEQVEKIGIGFKVSPLSAPSVSTLANENRTEKGL
jgi:integrase